MAPIASAHHVALAGMVALLTAGGLLLARLLKLGFLVDFLAQTVLVGLLTGVGFQVGIATLGEMLGVPVTSNRTVEQLAEVVHGLPQPNVATLGLAVTVVALVLVMRSLAPRLPGPLFAVVGAIAASAAFDFSGHGIVLIERVTGGLPPIGLPDVSWKEIPPLLPVAASAPSDDRCPKRCDRARLWRHAIIKSSMRTPTSLGCRRPMRRRRSAACSW